MLRRLSYKGVKLPNIYVASDATDVAIAKKNGLPFIIWQGKDDALVKLALFPWLKDRFPYLYIKEPTDTREVVEVFMPAERSFDQSEARGYDFVPSIDGLSANENEAGDNGAEFPELDGIPKVKLEDLMTNSAVEVDIVELQDLELLPPFVGEIASCIRKNLTGNRWTEGYNKKRRCAIGNMQEQEELPNLLLIDVSGSIPAGVSATMIALADTLRRQCNAELIIHSDKARWWDLSDELPDPDWIRYEFGCCNASSEFIAVLGQHILGREFGHVIAFGDNDSLAVREFLCGCHSKNKVAQVHNLHNYFVARRSTNRNQMLRCGFTKNWCNPEESEVNTDWVRFIDKEPEPLY